jgi:hypothetical protein
VVQGRAHRITPVPLTDEALAALPPGDELPEGGFWLVPPAASIAPAPTASATLAPFFATQTAVAPGVPAFFATQTAVAASGTSRQTQTSATATAAPRRRSAGPAPFVATQTALRPRGHS